VVSGKTIAKNVGFMMASQLITWVLAFILAVFLPHYLGAEAVGALSIANSIWIIMIVLTSFGMDTYLTKIAARDPAKISEHLSSSLLLRTIFFTISCVVVSFYVKIMHYNSQLIIMTWIQSIFFLLASYSSAISSILSGLESMEYISISNIVGKIAQTGLGILFIYLNIGVYPVIAVFILAPLISCIILFVALKRVYPLQIKLPSKIPYKMLSESSTYLISGLALVVYQQIDKPFISALVDTKTVGWYGTAMGLFGTMMFLPVVFGTVIFPSMARSYASGSDKLNIIAQRSFDLMFLISVPIGFGLVVIGQPLVNLLYGPEFAPSGGILMMLGVVLIFTYLNTILGQLLISVDRTSKWNVVMIIAIVLTLPIDYVMVPWTHQTFGNGGLGGVIAFLVTEFMMVVAAILLLPPNTLQWTNVRTAALTLCAGLLMMAASWWFRDTMMILSILIGAASYTTLVFLLRIIPREDMQIIREAIVGALGRLRRSKDAPASIGN
jgi:O-antigen/teichoic acid export membrane protein